MNNIVLIGMSGVGKSTIGKALAEKLNIDFIDTDTYIETMENKKVNHIFRDNGEDYFRTLETNVIKKIYLNNNLVIATGGGVILNKANIDFLKKNGTIIFLEATVEYIANNIYNSNEIRPLLSNKDKLLQNVKTLYRKREELYRSYGDYNISVENKKIQEIVYEILSNCVKIKS